MTLPTQLHRNPPAKKPVARKKELERAKFPEVRLEGTSKQGLLKCEDAIVLSKLRLMEGEFENWISKFDNPLQATTDIKKDPSPILTKKVSKREIPLSRRRRSRLPRKAREILQSWFDSHLEDPYPSWHTTEELMKTTKLTEKQIRTWFTNRRKRDKTWKKIYYKK